MANWTKQRYFEDIETGEELPAVSFFLSKQRMVMAASAMRDFNLAHCSSEFAKGRGAPDMYVNNTFIMAAFYRLLSEYIGLDGKCVQIGPIRLKKFTCCGHTATYHGHVTGKRIENGRGLVELAVSSTLEDGTVTTEGTAIVALPMTERE